MAALYSQVKYRYHASVRRRPCSNFVSDFSFYGFLHCQKPSCPVARIRTAVFRRRPKRFLKSVKCHRIHIQDSSTTHAENKLLLWNKHRALTMYRRDYIFYYIREQYLTKWTKEKKEQCWNELRSKNEDNLTLNNCNQAVWAQSTTKVHGLFTKQLL